MWIIVLIVIFFWVAILVEDRSRRAKAVKRAFDFQPQNILGNARLATDADCKLAGLYSSRGILIGYSPESGHPMRYNGDAMLTTIAPVGAGKGITQIISNFLALDDRSMIGFCPKGETPAVIARHRSRLGPCHLINPYEPEELKPAFRGIKRGRYNPMSILSDPRESPLNFSSNAMKIAEGCTFRESEGSGETEFWNSASRNTVHAVIMGVVRHEPREKQNLARVAEIIMTSEIFEWSRRIVRITKDGDVKKGLGRFATGSEDDRTLSGILATARNHVSFLAEPAIGHCLGGSDFRFRDLRDRVGTVLITVPVSEMPIGGGRLFRQLMSSMLTELLRPGRGKKRVLIMVDECFSLGALSSLETAIGIARGFGVQIWTFWQDLSQIETRYPRSYQTFLSNSAVRTFMTPQDEKTANYVSAQIGITQVSDWQKSVSFNPVGGIQEGWSRPLSARPLMHPHEVRAEDRMFLFVRGLAGVALSKRIPYFQRAEFRGKYQPNPYYRPDGFLKKIFGR